MICRLCNKEYESDVGNYSICDDCILDYAQNGLRRDIEKEIPGEIDRLQILTHELEQYVDRKIKGLDCNDEILVEPIRVELKCRWNSDFYYGLYLLQDATFVGRDISWRGLYDGEIVYCFELTSYSVDILVQLHQIIMKQYRNIHNEYTSEIYHMQKSVIMEVKVKRR